MRNGRVVRHKDRLDMRIFPADLISGVLQLLQRNGRDQKTHFRPAGR